jgi:flagellar motor switch protein FliG
MAFTGIQKAAMLLMGLDASTASELLKGVDAAVLRELAEQLVCLDAAGLRGSRQSTEVARQFCDSLQSDSGFRIEGFLKVLSSVLGQDV